ncbi:hypothetical protein CEXT_362791 [Caerostris extrusa]|uniref:Secreted protein n=1 Tax=Caerostris extrusa TaxID=172846 RepID=A0AAV4PPH9_CAEEX|nr:hypothetical protein CEXT_362791 [Caerostris extrusa]
MPRAKASTLKLLTTTFLPLFAQKSSSSQACQEAWQTTRHPADKANYINYNKNLQQISIKINTCWNNFSTTLSPHDNSLWKVTKNIRKRSFHSSSS